MTRRLFHIEGAPLLPEPYHVQAIGLPDVWLASGVSFEDDPEHGRLVTIADLAGLHRAIGLAIITSPGPIGGDELRFLRKQMRLTQEALARRLRVDVQTVANYEKGHTRMGAADAAVRLLYGLHLLPVDAKPEHVRTFFEAIAALLPELPVAIRREISGAWRDQALAA